ncbi:DUF6279 family lipoprotein [Pseudomonas saliphila]|uniref:DUF6279 family lipoprotein n=1 Tax=Pseudomonas saliphila TaxID=2586906 RepID=UPI00123C4735|nr:DUF6279 family lipoprotein [Pseudomonas saliphila]
MGLFTIHLLARLLLTVALSALLVACSMPRLGYQNIDHLIRWKVNDYVSLTREQRRWLNAEVQAQHAWHCHLDLPRYRPLLMAARDAVLEEQPDPESLRAQLPAWKNEIDLTLQRMLPGIVELLRQLNAEQLEQLSSELSKKQAELRERYVEPDERSQIAERSERMQKRLERWLGRLNPAQTQRIDQWADQPSDRNALWLANRQHWQNVLHERLQARQAPDFPSDMAALLLQPQQFWLAPYREQQPAVTDATIRMLSDVMLQTRAPQREHLRRQVDSLLRELERVRCPSLPEGMPPSAAATS